MSGFRGITSRRSVAVRAVAFALLLGANGQARGVPPSPATDAWQSNSPSIAADGLVTFRYEGDGTSVRIRGDFKPRNAFDSNWDEAGESMTPVAPGARAFVWRRRFEPDARLDYQFVIDGKPRTDPGNPRVRNGAIYGQVSELVMPKYREPALLRRLGEPPRGRMVDVTEPWASPRVRVYLPAGYDPAKRYPVIYTADGAAWSDFIRLPQWLDLLSEQRRVHPAIAVMIDAPEDRRRWYAFAPDYLAYLDRVVGHVDANYATIRATEGRTHVGTSAGARAAMYAMLERPRLFGGAAMLSPSIGGPPSWYAAWFGGTRRPPRGLKVWISAGSYEGVIADDARMMEGYFRKAGASVRVRYAHEEHSMATWRDAVPSMLEHVVGEPRR